MLPKKLSSRKKQWIAGTLVLVVVIVIVVAVIYQPRDIVLVRAESMRVESLSAFLARNYNPRSANSDVVLDVSTLAALAANVYEPEGAIDHDCSPNNPGRIPIKGWEKIKGWSYPEACNSALNGLHYEVWHSMDNDGIRYVAVVFRGTVPQVLAHWCSNLREISSPVCDPRSDQYLSIVPLIDEVLSGDYDEWGPDRYVFALGHSLGGGLAFLAGRSSGIKQVFLFDSSPVTGNELAESLHNHINDTGVSEMVNAYLKNADCQFRDIGGSGRGDLVVHSFFEHGEALAYLRLMKRWLGNWSNQAVDGVKKTNVYRTNILGGNPVSQHSIKALACALRKESSNNATQSTNVGTRP